MEVPSTPQFTEASKCPICHEPGAPTGQRPAMDGRVHRGTAFTFNCENERCRWKGTGWVVQVLPDGSIPVDKRGPKKFETSPGAESMGRRYIEQTLQQEGGEIPGYGQ
jgi:hypothetical protein